MNSTLDVMALSEEVEQDSQSGKLSKDLLAQGNTLYGINPAHPEFIERITPDSRRTLGQLKDVKFEAEISLLTDI
ncbi:hypothetical protein [Paraglaciecola sp.]|uniref:hypothetical protein n=1 Tax=Paraglaciecola sp. TaxID=1920173 RepID=UPI0032658549